jgi:hypothetical protein
MAENLGEVSKVNNLSKLIIMLLTIFFLSACGRHKFTELKQEIDIFSKLERKNLSKLNEKDMLELTKLNERIINEHNRRQQNVFPSKEQRLI